MNIRNAIIISAPAIFIGIFCFVGLLLKPIEPVVVLGLIFSVSAIALGVIILARAVKRHRTRN